MIDKDWWDTVTLIKCENDDCGGYSFKDDIEGNDGSVFTAED